MTNRFQAGSFSQRHCRTTSYSSVDESAMFSRGCYRPESAPSYSNYVPSFYKNPDPEITRKLEAFLLKPPLNSPETSSEHSGTQRGKSSESFERRALRPSSSYEYEVADRFKHLLPEKRTIHQLMLPPIKEGCQENFNHLYKNPAKEDEVFDEDLAEQFTKLKYCRYLRHGKGAGYQRSKGQNMGYLH